MLLICYMAVIFLGIWDWQSTGH